MIGFLYPAMALAALAAAIPVILHLIRRREVKRVTFPAIRYLRQAERRHARRLRLRHLLLLAARVSIVLLAAAAAAGPLIGRGDAEDHQPTALAIVVDESQSSTLLLGDRRLLDLFIERALLSLELTNSRDRIAVFSAVSPDDGAMATDFAGARAYLTGLYPTAGIAGVPRAMRQATTWLRSQDDRAAEMHVLTDMQTVSLLRDVADSTEQSEQGQGLSVVVYTPDHVAGPNGATGRVRAEVEPLTVGQQTSVSVSLHWFGPELPADAAVVRLVKGEDVLAVAEGRFGGDALLRMPPQDSGWVQGYAEIERQGLADDDRRYFTWFGRPTVRLAVLGEPGTFLDFALSALEQGGRLRRVAPSDAEVWISMGGERLEDGLAAGNAVIVIPPPSPLDLPRLNSRLGRAGIPWRYEPQGGPSTGATRIEESSPIAGLSGLEVSECYALMSTGLSGDTALVRLRGGEPWLVRGATTDGTAYVLLGSPLTPEASEIPVSAAMVPFVDALVGGWARRGIIDRTGWEGAASIRLLPRARQVVYPDGSRRAVEGGSWFKAAQGGNYTVLDEEDVIMAFSVNAPLAEANLAKGGRGDLEAILPAADWSWSRASDPADWRRSTFRARQGRLAWRPLVLLLVLVSIVEATLAASGRRRSASPGDLARTGKSD